MPWSSPVLCVSGILLVVRFCWACDEFLMVVTFLVILIVSSVLVFDTFHVQMCWIFWLSKFGYLSVLSSLD